MITNKELWEKLEKTNTDPYGKACVGVAREVMRLLDVNETFDPYELICMADRNVGAGGITGFMAGMVAQIVAQCHSRGSEFNDAWNARFGVSKALMEDTINEIVNVVLDELGSRKGFNPWWEVIHPEDQEDIKKCLATRIKAALEKLV